VRRRELITLIGGAAAAWPLAARAQQAYRLGILSGRSRDEPNFAAFFEELQQAVADFVGWARVVRPAAQADFLAPAVGDEVLIAFEGESLDQHFVLGSLWDGRHRSSKKPHRSTARAASPTIPKRSFNRSKP
jgi:uncharacterized protein involved in type VI secretion and phage assembly